MYYKRFFPEQLVIEYTERTGIFSNRNVRTSICPVCMKRNTLPVLLNSEKLFPYRFSCKDCNTIFERDETQIIILEVETKSVPKKKVYTDIGIISVHLQIKDIKYNPLITIKKIGKLDGYIKFEILEITAVPKDHFDLVRDFLGNLVKESNVSWDWKEE